MFQPFRGLLGRIRSAAALIAVGAVVSTPFAAWADEIRAPDEPVSVPETTPTAPPPADSQQSGQLHPAPHDDIHPEGDRDHHAHPPHGSLANVGAKLSNPISDVWAMFTQFGLTFSDGDVNTGNARVGGNMIFQPVLPIPLYGEGADAVRLIVRPAIPVLFGQPVPDGFNSFDEETELGDTLLPLVVNVPAGDWILAAGPTFGLPTSTDDAFGSQQWEAGPAAVIGWKNKDLTLGVFPQYLFGIGSRGDQGSKPDSSHMSLLYFGFLNLPNAWQVGFNPTITYDNKATSGNKWNVPIGLVVAKTTKIGKRPVKFQFGMEYSVVSQDDFGQRFQIKLNIIPVIQGLIKNPIFGGV